MLVLCKRGVGKFSNEVHIAGLESGNFVVLFQNFRQTRVIQDRVIAQKQQPIKDLELRLHGLWPDLKVCGARCFANSKNETQGRRQGM